MMSIVKGMHRAMETMNLEHVRISLVMDKFEAQFSDLDVQTSYMEDAMGSTTAVSTPQDQVDSLMHQMAEEANIELQQDLADKEVPSLPPPERSAMIGEEDSTLADRLRALRPAT
ncbi:vacuolar protein-sorting-associated protein 46 [Lactifluus volemus]|nr:vacuolar protein-sorting-associated protein 46 [Lactifluus volemus]